MELERIAEIIEEYSEGALTPWSCLELAGDLKEILDSIPVPVVEIVSEECRDDLMVIRVTIFDGDQLS